MFNLNKTYTFSNEGKVASKSAAVILTAISLTVISSQSNLIYKASADQAPITAPITAPSSNPSNGSGNSNGGNSGGGSSSNSGGSVGAPSCNEQAPTSAPKITSALTSGKNEITLNWEKANGPVTHYVLAYGFEKGKPIYGNPNIGNVTSFKVKGLSGGFTYFFKVRASNGCRPGENSSEIGVKVGGKFINSPAAGFKLGILGKSIQNINQANPAVAKPVVFEAKNTNQVNTGLIGKVFSFFKGLFN